MLGTKCAAGSRGAGLDSTMAATGTEKIRIARPVEVVRAQFFDVLHHCDNGVHSGPAWQLLGDDHGKKSVRIGRQIADIFWEEDVLWLAITDGPGAGSRIAHRFLPSGSDTDVIATFTVPLPGPLGLLSPLVKWFVARQLRKGLREDALDLRTYPP